MSLSPVSELTVRVNYSEVDQMGVVYHARYIVWLDMARTEHLRRTGTTYRDMEASGYRLAVAELQMRYRQPARYDDLVRIRCWVRELASRKVTFGYAVELAESGSLLATGMTAMLVLRADMTPTRLPDAIRSVLMEVPDPVRL
ncbi:MAG: acyl-CoA thioesterase [Gemmatimonadota bacterium]